MDNEQAKLILSAYRPGGEDASDPFFAEALDQVRQDPELSQWFTEQRRFDQSIQAALQADAPPSGLRESLLLNRKIVRMTEPATRNRFWAKPTSWMALAASIILLIGIGLMLRAGTATPMSGEQFVQKVLDLNTGGQISLGKMSSDPEELRQWLAHRRSPSEFELPGSLKKIGAMGCQTFTINGHKVSLLCFMLDKDRIVHFFVIDSNNLEGAPGSQPRFQQVDNIAIATWSEGGRTYVLAGKDVDEETLSRLI
mgnify:CR=1 FL=1